MPMAATGARLVKALVLAEHLGDDVSAARIRQKLGSGGQPNAPVFAELRSSAQRWAERYGKALNEPSSSDEACQRFPLPEWAISESMSR